MPLEILTVPCLSDNYAFLAHDPETRHTTLIDAPEAAPILAALSARGWSLDQVLLTHHHYDHIDGLAGLQEHHTPKVVGAKADAHRLPALDQMVSAGDTVTMGSETGSVLDVSGHTIGHVAFHFTGAKAVFTADSLMALGCGRLFEGTPAQMWASLSLFLDMPDDTVVYSGHEYTEANGRFAATIEPDNQALKDRITAIAAARAEGRPTVPSLLGLEKATNPFLRAPLSEVKQAINMGDATDVDVFTEIRRRKDNF